MHDRATQTLKAVSWDTVVCMVGSWVSGFEVDRCVHLKYCINKTKLSKHVRCPDDWWLGWFDPPSLQGQRAKMQVKFTQARLLGSSPPCVALSCGRLHRIYHHARLGSAAIETFPCGTPQRRSFVTASSTRDSPPSDFDLTNSSEPRDMSLGPRADDVRLRFVTSCHCMGHAGYPLTAMMMYAAGPPCGPF